MARRKKDEQPDTNTAILKQMFPDLKTRDDDEPEQTAGGGKPAPDLAAQLAELKAQLASQSQELESARRERAAITTVPVADTMPQAPQIDPKSAPDPIVDPAGYAKFIQDNISAGLEYRQQLEAWQARQHGGQQARIATLWEDFSKTHPDYAKDQRKVRIAAQQVADRAAAKQLNVDNYMFRNSSQFMADVVKEMDDLFGQPGKVDNTTDDDDEDDRSGGIFGGQEGNNKPAQITTRSEKLGSMSADINAWQEKSGFHR